MAPLEPARRTLVAPTDKHRHSILITSFNYRSFANWEPAFRQLSDRGHLVRTAMFPRVSDPDHERLLDLPFENVALAPIGTDFRPLARSMDGILSDLARWVRAERPDLIWMCTFHGGPEQHIRKRLLGLPDRPLTVGVQHGMAHDWPGFESMTERFDLFGTFGQSFLEHCSPGFRRKMVVVGLPKLDAIRSRPRSEPVRRILFAAQKDAPVRPTRKMLAGLSEKFGAEIVVRPHPEHRDAFRRLFKIFTVSTPDEPLPRALENVDAMVTTGSTAALEGLAAGLRVAILPCEWGHVYEPAGIVARSFAASDVAEVFGRFDDEDFRAGIARFLHAATGAASHGRTELTVAAIDQLLAGRDHPASQAS
jgi:hypothetical protein